MVGCAEYAKKLPSGKQKKRKLTAVEKALANDKESSQSSFYHDPWQSKSTLSKASLLDEKQHGSE